MLTQEQPQKELPPAMPIVSMELELGTEAAHFNFDYNEFYSLATQAEMTDEEISSLTIHFQQTEHKKFDARYFHRRRNVVVGKPARRKPEDCLPPDCIGDFEPTRKLSRQDYLNVLIRHETGHWVGDTVMEPGHLQRRRVIQFLGGNAVTSVSATLALLCSSEPKLAVAPIPIGFGLLVVYANRLSRKYPTRFDIPHERFAYAFEAANRNYHNIVTYEARKKLHNSPG